jgi:hypothetical protein
LIPFWWKSHDGMWYRTRKRVDTFSQSKEGRIEKRSTDVGLSKVELTTMSKVGRL